MSYDHIEYGKGALVSSCCYAPVVEDHDWMHGETLYECSNCRFQCTKVEKPPIE